MSTDPDSTPTSSLHEEWAQAPARFLFRWIVGLLIAVPVGALVGGVVLTLPFFILSGLVIEAVKRTGVETMSVYFVGGALAGLTGIGAAVGLVQARSLGVRVRPLALSAVSAAALPLGAVLGSGASAMVAATLDAGDMQLRLPGFVGFAVAGAFVGAAQALILRRRVSGIYWWPVINMTALSAAFVVFLATAGTLSRGGNLVSGIAPLIALIAFAVAAGLITGAGMLALLGDPMRRYLPFAPLLILPVLAGVTGFGDYRTRATNAPVAFILQARSPIRAIAWSPDGTRLHSTEGDGILRVWDTATGRELQSIKVENYTDYAATWNADASRLVTVGDDIRVWDASIGRGIGVFPGPEGWDSAVVAWSPSGSLLAAAGPDSTLQLVDGQAGKLLVRFPAHTKVISAMAWAPSGKMLAAGGENGVVRIWDTSGREVSLLPRKGRVTSLEWSPDGSRLAAGADVEVRIWNVGQARMERILRPVRSAGATLYIEAVRAIRWSRNGDRLAAIVLGGIHVWNAQTGSQEVALYDSVMVRHLAWNPSGSRVAFSFQVLRQIPILDVRLRREVGALHGHTDYVEALVWSPDERFLATGSIDGTIRIWSTESSTP